MSLLALLLDVREELAAWKDSGQGHSFKKHPFLIGRIDAAIEEERGKARPKAGTGGAGGGGWCASCGANYVWKNGDPLGYPHCRRR